jgi:hypothetical protein
MIVKFQISRFPFVDDGVWGAEEIVTECFDIQASMVLGESKDTFSFKIPNPRGSKKQQFNAQDLIAIYLLINNETPQNSNLIFYGILKKVVGDFSSKGKYLRVEGVSFGEITTTALVFYDPGNNTQNVMQYLQGCLNSVELRNTNFTVTWDSGNPTIPSTGGTFPDFTTAAARMRDYDKSLASLLDKYLTNDYTNDGRYYWYVNKEKKLVIRSRKTSNPIDTWTEGVSFKSIKFNIDTSKVYNFIVVKCGWDNNNNQVTTRYDDPVSRAKNGFRYYLIVDNNITKELQKTGLYSDNDDLRAEAKRIGENRAKDFGSAHNKGVLEATCILTPTTNYTVGDVINLTTTSYATIDYPNGLTNYPMRIKSIQYTKNSLLVTLAEEVAT